MAAFCQHCGASLPWNARFCSGCGATVPPAQPVPGKPLVRPRVGRQAAGVCIGMAQAYGWDVAVIRTVAVLALILSGGIVGVAYLAAWIGIPEEPLDAPGEYPPHI